MLCDLGDASLAAMGGADEQVLEDGEIGEGLRDLEGARNPKAGPRLRRKGRHILTGEADRSGIGLQRTANRD